MRKAPCCDHPDDRITGRSPRLHRIELRSAEGKLITAVSAMFPAGWLAAQVKRRLQERVRAIGKVPKGATWVFPAPLAPRFVPTVPRNEPARSAAMRRKGYACAGEHCPI